MMALLLKLLNAPLDEMHQLMHAALAFRAGLKPAWGALLAVGLVALVMWLYRRERAEIPVRRKYAMATLRALVLLLLLLLLLRPVLVLTLEGSIRQTLIFLLDGSASMAIQDRRTDQADVDRAACASQPHPSRAELAQAMLSDPTLHLTNTLARDHDLAAFAFGAELMPLDTITMPAATAPCTALGDCLRELLSRKRGQPIAGIVLVTDGANNAGSAPIDAATMAKEQDVPLYIYGVGVTAPRDIVVANIFAPDVAFLNDELTVTVCLRAQGIARQAATLVLRLGEEQVAEQAVSFAGEPEQVVALRFTPSRAGEFDLMARIEPRDEDAIKDNNRMTKRLRVVDAPIRVLLVEQSPRWEFRHLQMLLLRDRRVELNTVLFDADPMLTRAENTPYLERFPTSREELLKFDVIVFGDVDPKRLQPEQIEWLGDFAASYGGSIIVIAGRQYTPWAYRGTALETLLPVELDSSPNSFSAAHADTPRRLELTVEGRIAPMLRLSDKETEALAIWQQLPPLDWIACVSRAKPAAEVLAVDPDPACAMRTGKMPVIAIQRYGMGQTLYIGTDSTWRWRENRGEHRYARCWSQIIQHMALARLLGAAKRTQLFTDRQDYFSGERVTVYARLFTPGFQPVTEPVVRALCTPRGPAAEPVAAAEHEVSPGVATSAVVLLRPVPDQPAMYRGEFIAPNAGQYRLFLESDRDTHLDFNVVAPTHEVGDTAMNEVLLREMAARSGGAFLREEDLPRLPRMIRRRLERVRSSVEIELWSSPVLFVLVLSLVTVEWVMRKRSQLK